MLNLLNKYGNGIFVGCGTISLAYLYNMSTSDGQFHSSSKRLDGKTIVLTGGTSGIGEKMVRNLSIRHGAKVVVATRDLEKCERMKKQQIEQYEKWTDPEKQNFAERKILEKEIPNFKNPKDLIDCEYCDLKSFKSVAEFAKNVEEKYEHVDSLINNAGILRPEPTITTKKNLIKETTDPNNPIIDKTLSYKTAQTDDNLEETLQVNTISHFLLSKLLAEKIEKTSSLVDSTGAPDVAKIINVTCSSQKYGILDFTDMNLTKTNEEYQASYEYRSNEFYKTSKLGNVLITKEFSKLHPNLNTTAVDPGIAIDTNISRNLENTQGLTSYLNKYINPGYYFFKFSKGRTSDQCARDITARLFEKTENGSLYDQDKKALNLLRVDEIIEKQNKIFGEQLWNEKRAKCKCTEEVNNISVSEEDILAARKRRFGASLDINIYSDSYSKVLWKYSEMVSS